MTAIRLLTSSSLALLGIAALFWVLAVMSSVDPGRDEIPILCGIGFEQSIPNARRSAPVRIGPCRIISGEPQVTVPSVPAFFLEKPTNALGGGDESDLAPVDVRFDPRVHARVSWARMELKYRR